jgi:hypothetical protein
MAMLAHFQLLIYAVIIPYSKNISQLPKSRVIEFWMTSMEKSRKV